MSLVDVDSWLMEYEACERLSHSIQTQMVQRDNKPKLSDEYYTISGKIRIQLKQFSTELDQLRLKLDVSGKNGALTFEELERRQRQIESLQSKLNQLQNKFRTAGRNDRDSLLSPGTSRLWDDDDVAMIDPNTQTTDDLRRKHVRIIEDQNEGLETLSQSLARQKHLASRLNEEVEQHNEIIDNLADTMDNTNTRVSSETRNVGLVSRQDRTWGKLVNGLKCTTKLQESCFRVLDRNNETIKFPSQYPAACLLGCVSVQDCLPQEEYRKIHPNGESGSPFVFICTDPHELPIRFPIKGSHKIYEIDPKIHTAAVKSLQRLTKLKAEEDI